MAPLVSLKGRVHGLGFSLFSGGCRQSLKEAPNSEPGIQFDVLPRGNEGFRIRAFTAWTLLSSLTGGELSKLTIMDNIRQRNLETDKAL